MQVLELLRPILEHPLHLLVVERPHRTRTVQQLALLITLVLDGVALVDHFDVHVHLQLVLQCPLVQVAILGRLVGIGHI